MGAAGVIEIRGRAAGGAFFPIVRLDAASLMAEGYDGAFILEYIGQRDQLNVVSQPCVCATPQADSPEQPTNRVTGGSPARTTECDVVKVTVFFATGQSKVWDELAKSGLPDELDAATSVSQPGRAA
jgi:hypothetical protein